MRRLSDDWNLGATTTRNPDAEAASRLLALKARRKRWLDVHLWLGLILGFFMAVFGLTGSILVFYQEIDGWLQAESLQVSPPPEGERAFRPLGEILAAANAVAPAEGRLGFLDYPGDERTAYTLGYQVKRGDNDADEWRVFVDPYSARVSGKQLIKAGNDLFPVRFIPFVFRLHYALLAGATGVTIVGVMAVLLLFSVLTGLILWWPLTGKWKRVFVIKSRASAERLNHDLHQTSGFYTFPVVLAVLLSGIYMNLPDYFLAPVKLLSPGTRGFMDSPHAAPAEGRDPIGLDRALDIVRTRYPEGRINWLSNPDDPSEAYRISLRDVPGLSRFWSERIVSVDPYSGVILEVRDPASRRTAGETFVDWQWPLHSGKAFGWTGRILVFLAGLACPLLFVTGVIRWLQKRRARRVRSA
ncbi:PepSY domain-containing protein [Methylococcus sp. EFPC2]|uniref:PepSY-associated TM helix domain-containing protein n=1 Tax=Methylococcus sp. EFPC2 TaxID=2812648 RepID=UPI0019673B20|nr:PepSY-associated TM helix domain-containing protein [Methylococcus sp. EFPC2]QSA96009.1 PepSY domain-containing protein [Methylococcus sp. EFPC2]